MKNGNDKKPSLQQFLAVIDGFHESKKPYRRLFFVSVATSAFLSFVLRDLSTAFFLYGCHSFLGILKSKPTVYEEKRKK
jgi:hypothetical protein